MKPDYVPRWPSKPPDDDDDDQQEEPPTMAA
jgi:hypothetical protein